MNEQVQHEISFNAEIKKISSSYVPPDVLGDLSVAAPAAPSATPVKICHNPDMLLTNKLKTLETLQHGDLCDSKSSDDSNLTLIDSADNHSMDLTPLLPMKEEQKSDGDSHCLSGEDTDGGERARSSSSPKSWSQKDMENALEALKNQEMSLTKASTKFGIPATTLWQRAHRLGIDTPKKEGTSKSWSEEDLRAALQALRDGTISANKASKAYGIPSSTLYKIARREGIRLSAPFNAAPTSWRRSDLQRALGDIKRGQASVQSASSQYGIPTGTLYGRCKREGIELSRTNPTPWSEDAMEEALESVRVGQMSINQAAIHFNLPYSSLYGRFKRCKYNIHDFQDDPHLQSQDNMEYDTPATEPHTYEYQQNPIQTSHSILNDEDPSKISYSSYYDHQEQYDTSTTQHTSYQNFHYSGQAMYNHNFENGIASS